MKTFKWPIRVYWEDTDAGGIVYYANYLRFMERARTEWLRAIGVEQEVLLREQRLQFVVVDVQASYREPARYADELEIVTRVGEMGRASITFDQEVLRKASGGTDSKLLVTGKVRVACLDADKFRPRALPESVLKEMSR